jgi:2-amino-4-hydroxy-6-hydroxymethyldihydropteridine diphosphokinase
VAGYVPPAVEAYIALGANMGQAAATVVGAMDALSSVVGVALIARSSLWQSAPIDASGDDYVNAVVQVQTTLGPQDLLEQLFAIERKAGRQRPYRNAPRTLDLDLLLYGDAQIHTETLQVPHPRMWERAFVLRPLHELAPQCVSESCLQAVSGQRLWLIQCPDNAGSSGL